MHSYKLATEIPADRKLTIEIPNGPPAGHAEILVFVCDSESEIEEFEEIIDLCEFRLAKAETVAERTVSLDDLKRKYGMD